MKPPTDPPRLLDPASGAPDLLRAALHDTRRELPSEAQIEELARQLGPLLTPPPGGAPPDGGAPAPADIGPGELALPMNGTLGLKLAAAAALVVTAGTLGIAVLRPPGTDAGAEAHGIAPTATAIAAGIPTAPAQSTGAAAGTASLAAPTPKAPDVHAMRLADPPAPPETMAEMPTPAATGDSSNPPSPPPFGSGQESEAAVLWQAQRALSTSPERALALSAEHARLFPSGALAEEREVIAILALARMGRTAEARGRAEQLLVRSPKSAHRRRLEAVLR